MVLAFNWPGAGSEPGVAGPGGILGRPVLLTRRRINAVLSGCVRLGSVGGGHKLPPPQFSARPPY